MFKEIFDFVMKLEGGFVLHKNATEEAETYAGIYRAAHPYWEGWIYIDEGETPPVNLVEEFYKREFWDKIPVDDEFVKAMVFEYGVNAGIGKSITLLQEALGVVADGIIGKKTQAAIKAVDKEFLLDRFTLTKVDMYTSLVNRNSSKYGIYLRGWLNRALTSCKWFKEKL